MPARCRRYKGNLSHSIAFGACHYAAIAGCVSFKADALVLVTSALKGAVPMPARCRRYKGNLSHSIAFGACHYAAIAGCVSFKADALVTGTGALYGTVQTAPDSAAQGAVVDRCFLTPSRTPSIIVIRPTTRSISGSHIVTRSRSAKYLALSSMTNATLSGVCL